MAAIVAIVVVLLTQGILGARQRTELLTKKLEELLLSLIEETAQTGPRRDMIEKHGLMGGNCEELYPMTEAMYSVKNQSKIEMYVRLYFPSLREAQKNLNGSNNSIITLAFQVQRGETPKVSEVSKSFTEFVKQIERLKDEVLSNKAELVSERWFAKSFAK